MSIAFKMIKEKFDFSFPSEYIGTLTGVMWTVAGLITFIQYGLVKLTDETVKSWRVSERSIELGFLTDLVSFDRHGRFFYH